MKAIIFFIFFILLAIPPVFGQIKIGDNPQNIDASSVLELESTSKVLVITRVTTAEMEAITPQRGGMVYNTDTECINYYDGTQWINLCDAVDFSITNDPIINGRSTIEITESAAGYNLEVAKNSILGDNIIDGGIGPDDIQDNSITQDKLAAASVGSSEISENAVGSVEIRDGSIAPEDIANTVPDQLLTTDENGIVQWEDSNDFYDLTFNKLDTTLTLERSTIAGVSTISLGALIGSDDQRLDLTGNVLSIENDPNTYDLSTYLQQLSINPAGTEISLTNGGTITLPNPTIDTDEQNLGNATLANEILTINIENGDATTADLSPLATDAVVTAGLALKEDVANKSNDVTLGNSTNLYPTQNAVKIYVDNTVGGSAQTIVSADANNSISPSINDGGAFYNDGDGDNQNELQDIVFNETTNILTISTPLTTGNEVNLSSLADAPNLNNGQIFVGNATNIPTGVDVGGDVTMNNIGQFTIEDEAVTPAKIEPAPGTLTEDQVLITNNITGNVEWADFPPGGGAGDDDQNASEVPYDPAASGLTATNTQAAIDELVNNGLVNTDEQDASEVPYDGTVSGLTATTTQAALDELAGITEIDGIIGNEVTAATDATLELSGTGTTADPLTLDVAALGINTAELAAGAVTLPKLADGTAAGQLLQWNGTEWVYIQEADITATVTEIDGIIGNEVTAATDATLELSGTGTTADPLTLDVSALGIDTDELAAGAVTLPKLADGTAAGQLLQWNGTEWVFIQEADITATVSEIDGIIGNEVTAATDATLELSGTGTTADPLTLDVAALGINTAELAAGAVTLPKLADGTAAGQLLQWNGTEWVFIQEADITATVTEIDGIIGNEVTAATDATLELSGTGTTADPLTLDVAALGINTAELAAGAVTLTKLADGTAAGQLLQWNGTEWVYIQEADITATVTEVDGIVGNEVTAPTDTTLELSGMGTAADPLTLDVAALGIGTNELAAGAVTPAKIQASATDGQFLATNGVNVEWQDLTNPATTGSILFSDGTGGIVENNDQLFWDQANDRLGIGTDSPGSKVQVIGQVQASSFSANPNGSQTSPPFRFISDANSGLFLANTSELGFTTNSVEKMRIIGNGNVGIGVTVPLENLHVADNIRTDGSFLSNDNAIGVPDYVFQKYFLGNSILNPSYSFKTLAEIEAFVKENNHLPGIQSAQAVKEQGFWNVSESSRVNLEKIEELFLHTIEQEKKIKELQKANTSMSSELEALKAQMIAIKNMLSEKQNN